MIDSILNYMYEKAEQKWKISNGDFNLCMYADPHTK